jgi:hypothetical protein
VGRLYTVVAVSVWSLLVLNSGALKVVRALMESEDVLMAGLGPRDTLTICLEAGLCLCGARLPPALRVCVLQRRGRLLIEGCGYSYGQGQRPCQHHVCKYGLSAATSLGTPARRLSHSQSALHSTDYLQAITPSKH